MLLSCKEHGEFITPVAERHWKGKDGGCQKCAHAKRMEVLKPGNISKIEREWLDGLGVPIRQHRVSIESKTFIVDGFDPSSETIYECYGKYWHGCPKTYNADDIHPTLGVSFGSLYEKTMQREEALRALGYSIVVKWV